MQALGCLTAALLLGLGAAEVRELDDKSWASVEDKNVFVMFQAPW